MNASIWKANCIQPGFNSSSWRRTDLCRSNWYYLKCKSSIGYLIWKIVIFERTLQLLGRIQRKCVQFQPPKHRISLNEIYTWLIDSLAMIQTQAELVSLELNSISLMKKTCRINEWLIHNLHEQWHWITSNSEKP